MRSSIRSAVLVTLGPPVGKWCLDGPRLVLDRQPCNSLPGTSTCIVTLEVLGGWCQTHGSTNAEENRTHQLSPQARSSAPDRWKEVHVRRPSGTPMAGRVR
mmetsp:Transcript_544/g.554  ORF Transcript_544/g.554 Transcript_544/m.554 type:complete len:101 (+) Transcript_544:147-449(+)